MKYADRMNKLGTETAFEVLQRISEFPAERREKIISFALGEPDFDTPEHIKQAGIKAIEENYTHYSPSGGILELRKAIADYASEIKMLPLGPENITVFSAAKIVVCFAILTCTNPGDEIIYPNPGYPIYESLINVFGCKPVPAQLWEEEDWNYNTDELRELITGKTSMIIINSPQNPTGSVLNQKNLEAIAEISLENDIWILSDEIYSNLIYDNEQYKCIGCIPDLQDRTIILDGFSKFFAMTGWRLGYSITNPKIAEEFAKWNTNTISCPASFTQQAGLTAMLEDKSPSWEMVKEFETRRNLICDLINDIDGMSVKKPKGSFYVFANVTEACEKLKLVDSLAFQNYLLEEADVAVLSRDYFGKRSVEETQEYVRFSYCVSQENIKKGLERIKKVVE
jgi:aspartate aminotransferase